MVKAGLAFSIGTSGFEPLLQGMLNHESGGTMPIDDKTIDHLGVHVSVLMSEKTYDLDSVSLTDGQVRNFKGTFTSLKQDGPGSNTLDAALDASFVVHYGNWHEAGKTSPGRGVPSYDYAANAGPWEFNVDKLSMTFQLQFNLGKVPDPFDTQTYWAVQAVNVHQTGPLAVSNVAAPSKSCLTANSWLSCIQDRINQHLSEVISQQDLADAFAAAINSRLKTLPDSGKLTDKITYCFPPLALAWPPAGGMQAAISGRVLYGTTKYAELQAPDLTLPDPPTDVHFTVVIPPYEVDALLWAFQQAGTFAKVYNAQTTSDTSTYNTDTYQDALPELYDFAPSAQFTLSASTAPYTGTGSQSPRVAIQPVWVLTADLLTRLGVPDDVRQALTGGGDESQSALDLLYPTAQAFEGMLNQYLTEAQYRQWGTKLEAAAAMDGLICQTGVAITISMLRHGQQTNVVQCLLQLTLLGANFSVVDKKDGSGQVLAFDLDVARHTVTNLTTTAGLTIPSNRYNTWYTHLLGIPVTDALNALKPPPDDPVLQHEHCLPLPQFRGFRLTNTKITVDGKQGVIRLSGDNDPGSLASTGRRRAAERR